MIRETQKILWKTYVGSAHGCTLAKPCWRSLSFLQSKWWRCGHQLAQPRGGLCNSHPSSSLCLHNQAKLVSASEPSVCYMNSKSEAKQLSNHVGNTGPTESSGIVSELTWFHQGSRWTEWIIWLLSSSSLFGSCSNAILGKKEGAKDKANIFIVFTSCRPNKSIACSGWFLAAPAPSQATGMFAWWGH